MEATGVLCAYAVSAGVRFVRTLRLVSRIFSPMHRILPSATRASSQLCQRLTRETLDLKPSCYAFEGHVER